METHLDPVASVDADHHPVAGGRGNDEGHAAGRDPGLVELGTHREARPVEEEELRRRTDPLDGEEDSLAVRGERRLGDGGRPLPGPDAARRAAPDVDLQQDLAGVGLGLGEEQPRAVRGEAVQLAGGRGAPDLAWCLPQPLHHQPGSGVGERVGQVGDGARDVAGSDQAAASQLLGGGEVLQPAAIHADLEDAVQLVGLHVGCEDDGLLVGEHLELAHPLVG